MRETIYRLTPAAMHEARLDHCSKNKIPNKTMKDILVMIIETSDSRYYYGVGNDFKEDYSNPRIYVLQCLGVKMFRHILPNDTEKKRKTIVKIHMAKC